MKAPEDTEIATKGDGMVTTDAPPSAAAMAETMISSLPPREACEAAIARLGEINRHLARIEARKSEQVAKVTAEAEEKAKPLQDERPALESLVKTYCETERETLTGGFRTKTVKLRTGEVGWREGQPRLTIDERSAVKEQIIAKLRKLAGAFLRDKVEIDKTAIKNELVKNPKAPVGKIAGITLEPGTETFFIKPIEAPLADTPKAA